MTKEVPREKGAVLTYVYAPAFSGTFQRRLLSHLFLGFIYSVFVGGLGLHSISKEYSVVKKKKSFQYRKGGNFNPEVIVKERNGPHSPASCVRTLAAAAVIKALSSPEWKPLPDRYPGSRSLLPWIGVPCVWAVQRPLKTLCFMIFHWHTLLMAGHLDKSSKGGRHASVKQGVRLSLASLLRVLLLTPVKETF